MEPLSSWLSDRRKALNSAVEGGDASLAILRGSGGLSKYTYDPRHLPS